MEKRKQLIADGLQSAQDAQDGALKMKQEYESGVKRSKTGVCSDRRKCKKKRKGRVMTVFVEEAGNKADKHDHVGKRDNPH